MTARSIQDNLAQAFAAQRPAQAYLIVGPIRGEGRELAEWIGTQLLGDVPTIAQHAHPDMPWFEPEKKSRIIDVEMMRERILPFAQQSALSGGWKILVIVAADRMNATSANALLKTLEEPPEKTLFLLLAEALDDLLPTIISRCQVVHTGGERRLDEPWRSDLLALLAGITMKSPLKDAVRAERICAILDDMKAEAERIVRQENRSNTAVLEDADVVEARSSAKAKAWRNDLLLTLEQWMQDLVRIKASDGANVPLQFPEHRETLKARAARYTLANLLDNLSALETLAIQLDRSLAPINILPYWMDRFYL